MRQAAAHRAANPYPRSLCAARQTCAYFRHTRAPGKAPSSPQPAGLSASPKRGAEFSAAAKAGYKAVKCVQDCASHLRQRVCTLLCKLERRPAVAAPRIMPAACITGKEK